MDLESGHHKITTFGSQSALKSPLNLIKETIADIGACWQLAFMLAYRDLKAQYRRSFLGWLWLVIPPIAWAVGLTVLRKNNLADLGRTELHYSAYVLISMALWQIFNEALRGPINSFNANRSVLTKVSFPRESIIVANILKLSVNIVIQVALITLAFLYYKIPFTTQALAFPLAIVVLVLVGTAMGLLLTPIGLLYQDIGNGMPYLAMAGLAVTPVLFPMPSAANDGIFATVVRLNPVTPVIVTARELATGEMLTQVPQFFVASFLALLGLVVGLLLLRLAMPLVVERWSL